MFFRHFSLNTTIWFPGSAWEPNELQALPAELSLVNRLREAEPPRQCVPRQSLGTSVFEVAIGEKCLFFLRIIKISSIRALNYIPPLLYNWHIHASLPRAPRRKTLLFLLLSLGKRFGIRS